MVINSSGLSIHPIIKNLLFFLLFQIRISVINFKGLRESSDIEILARGSDLINKVKIGLK
jgi:hypothetical protein